MTKKEWVKSVFDGDPVEKVPMGFWHHFIPHSKMGQIPDDPQLQEEYFALNRKWLQDLDPDFVKIMTDGYLMLPIDIGSGTADEIANVKPRDLESFVAGSVRIAKGCREIYGSDTFLLFNVFSPFITLVKEVRARYKEAAYPTLIQMIHDEPEKIMTGLNKITDALIQVVDAVLGDDKADGIYLCTRQCTMPEDIVELCISATEIRLLEAACKYGDYNAAHICDFDGPQTNMSLYAKYPCKVFNWSVHTEGYQMSEGKKIFHGRTVMGGFDMNRTGVLFTGPKDAVKAETERILADVGRQGFILGADCTVDPEINVEHLRWVREFANG